MRHSVTPLPHAQCELTVTLSEVEFDQFLKRAAQQISNEIEISGFRKGKAPFEIVKKTIGEARLLERTADIAVRDSYPKILKETIEEFRKKNSRDLFPVGAPEITVLKLARGNEFVYKAVFAYLPEVSLPDYRAIASRVRKDKKEVSALPEEVQRSIRWILESRAVESAVTRPATTGDAVEIDFEIRHHGIRLNDAESKRHPLIIGKGRFIPGFEKELEGMKEGDEKEFSLKAPDDWHEKSIAGKELTFKVTMRSVRERKIPDLTDEFARSIGNFESKTALEESVRQGITEEKKEKERDRIRIAIIDEIAKNASMDIPNVLISAELKKMLSELKSGVTSMGMKWEDYLTHIKKTPEALEREWTEEANRRVRVALSLREIAQKEKIAPTEEEIQARANQFLRQYHAAEEAKKDIDPAELYEYTKSVLRNEKVFEFLEQC